MTFGDKRNFAHRDSYRPLDRAAPQRHCSNMNQNVASDAPEIAKMSFEDSLRALEQIVGRLESGDVPLDDSISLYERGEELRRHCQARLDAAQARIEKIVAVPGGQIASQPFDQVES